MFDSFWLVLAIGCMFSFCRILHIQYYADDYHGGGEPEVLIEA